ncbi:MAG: site-2 protease family protein, partial [Chloroflexi bacterium]|nr:site-2 protease family protein [Chloroflexota bacterium]
MGPLTSFVLAGIFALLDGAIQNGNEQLDTIFGYLWFINLALGIFNLAPAFPMDGGRVLRALVWKSTGSLSRANTVATTVGQLLGFALIGVGLFYIF